MILNKFFCLYLVMVICSLLPVQPALAENRRSTLANGMYAVLHVADARDKLPAPAAGSTILVYRDQFSPPDKRDPDLFVRVATKPFVPLVLELPPEAKKQQDGRTYLTVTLKRRHARALREFTRKHLGGRIAIVLDNDVVTMHKIRSVIQDGKMMITRCLDNACELIRSKLVGK